MQRPSVLFVIGFSRSGTSAVATALTEVLGAVSTTSGVLAESARLYDRPGGARLLREHVAESAALSGTGGVVLRNPYEMGREEQLLRDFPEAGVLMMRRRLPDIEASIARASGGRANFLMRMDLRWRVLGLTIRAAELPVDRVAFLSYEELRADPLAGARWAAHLVDPEALAEAYTRNAAVERTEPAPGRGLVGVLDGRWERAWTRARSAQKRA